MALLQRRFFGCSLFRLQGWNTASTEHWYALQTGKPCYEVPMKTNPDQLRAPTIRDAQVLGLVPSVTTILSIVNRPGLDAWRVSQLLQAVQEIQDQTSAAVQKDGEIAADDTMTAITARYKHKITHAAERGSSIHNYLERHLLSRASEFPTQGVKLFETAPHSETSIWPDVLLPVRDAVDAWLNDHVRSIDAVEMPFACRFGYGGKIDLVCTLKDGSVCVCDFKTQGAKKGRFTFHAVWPVQLIAYAVGIGAPKARLINFCLDMQQLGLHQIKDWSVVEPPKRKGGNSNNDDDDADPLTTHNSQATPDASLHGPYWESFRLAFALWCSPLGRKFVPQLSVPGCIQMPSWPELEK